MTKVPYQLAHRRPYFAPPFAEREYATRKARVLTAMAAAGLDCLIVWANAASYASITWLTAFEPVHGNAFAVLHQDGRLIVTMDGTLHCEPMHSMVWTCLADDLRISLGPLYGEPPEKAALLAVDAAKSARHLGIVGLGAMPEGLAGALRASHPGLVAADSVLLDRRLIKSQAEIALMRRAGEIADAAFAAVFEAIDIGVADYAVAAAAVGTMRGLGAYEAFETCVVGPPHVGLKHGYPRGRRLEPGDMLFLDLGANVEGYRSDVSRCTTVGPASGEKRDLLEMGLDIHEAGLEAIGPGKPIRGIAERLRKAVAGTRWEPHFYPEGFGHGVGLDLFEGPGGLFEGSNRLLEPGMTIAYEPMIVVEGLGTGVVEDTLLITETGFERLNHFPKRTWT